MKSFKSISILWWVQGILEDLGLSNTLILRMLLMLNTIWIGRCFLEGKLLLFLQRRTERSLLRWGQGKESVAEAIRMIGGRAQGRLGTLSLQGADRGPAAEATHQHLSGSTIQGPRLLGRDLCCAHQWTADQGAPALQLSLLAGRGLFLLAGDDAWSGSVVLHAWRCSCCHTEWNHMWSRFFLSPYSGSAKNMYGVFQNLWWVFWEWTYLLTGCRFEVIYG